MNKIFFIICLIIAFLYISCDEIVPPPTPSPTPLQTPVPTEEPSPDPTPEPTPEGPVHLTISSVEGAPGSVVSVEISLTNVYTAINNCNFAIQFESTNLSYVLDSVLPGEIIPGQGIAGFNSNGPEDHIIVFIYHDPTQNNYPIQDDGIFATVQLEISETASAGNYEISVIPQDDVQYGWDMADQDLNNIELTVESGYVTVISRNQ